jgi:hypothetical protein
MPFVRRAAGRRNLARTPFVPTQPPGHGKRRGHRQGGAQRSTPPLAALTALAAPRGIGAHDAGDVWSLNLSSFAGAATGLDLCGPKAVRRAEVCQQVSPKTTEAVALKKRRRPCVPGPLETG